MTTADGLRLCCNPEHTKDATYKTLGPFWHHVADWPKDSAGFCESNLNQASDTRNKEKRIMMTGTILSRKELQTLFYVGRKLELIGCYVPMSGPKPRTVRAHRSYGYDMETPEGKVSRLDFQRGQVIEGFSPAGNGFTEVVIWDNAGIAAAHYRLL